MSIQERKLLKKMVAHAGHCDECGGDYVKMLRDAMGRLSPDQCFCCNCGQLYYMEIPDIKAWEIQQWEEKGKLE